jgi:Bacteriophage head to tail connecting protein
MDTTQGMPPAAMPANSLLETLRKRYNAAKYVADLWIPIQQASYFYCIPFRNRYYLPGKEFQGTIQNTRVYDTTAVEAVTTFVSKIHSTMTPPQVQWGFLEVDDAMVKDPDNEDNVKVLEEAQLVLNEYMRNLFTYIHASNFDVTINENYYDLAVGTSALVINQINDDMPFMCTSIPADKLAIEEAVNGNIETWFRTWQNLKICELNTRWPNIIISPNLQALMASDPDAVVRNIYEGVAYFANQPKKYCYAVWADNDLLYTQWLDSSPGIVWRWKKTNNETWGRGPIMEALPSIISLNEMARVELASANLNTFRPYMAFSDAVFNPHTFKLEPFTIIPIAPIGTNGQVPLIPLPNSASPEFAQMTMADLRMQIKQLLYAEQPQDSRSVQPQTAYELAMKQSTLAEQIGPIFTRIQQEFLWPVIKRFAYILHTMGKLPYPDVGGLPIKFKYKSPLALAKGRADVEKFVQYVQVMQGVMGPEATQLYINPKTTPYMLAELLQIDERFLNKPNQIQAVMQQVQNKQSLMEMANPQGEMPQQPPNPSQQAITS